MTAGEYKDQVKQAIELGRSGVQEALIDKGFSNIQRADLELATLEETSGCWLATDERTGERVIVVGVSSCRYDIYHKVQEIWP